MEWIRIWFLVPEVTCGTCFFSDHAWISMIFVYSNDFILVRFQTSVAFHHIWSRWVCESLPMYTYYSCSCWHQSLSPGFSFSFCPNNQTSRSTIRFVLWCHSSIVRWRLCERIISGTWLGLSGSTVSGAWSEYWTEYQKRCFKEESEGRYRSSIWLCQSRECAWFYLSDRFSCFCNTGMT